MKTFIAVSGSYESMNRAADAIRRDLAQISALLSRGYGGPMEHLWINLELWEPANGRPPFSFRFQKRVAAPRELAAFKVRPHYNVGHYSVRPSLEPLLGMRSKRLRCHLLQVLYNSTVALEGRRQLRGFNVSAFRSDFASALRRRGCLPTERSEKLTTRSSGRDASFGLVDTLN
jgi:hypothetical protein